jgi:shikimate kinase
VTAPLAVIVGAPGAGKSTVGRRVARALDVRFRDTDHDVEARAGKPVSEIFIDDGEATFRSMEKSAVAAALGEHAGILALGGGAILDPDTRALLAEQRVVWLRVGSADAAARVGLTGARPLLLGNVRGRLITLLEERNSLYEQVASVTIDTDGRSIDDVTADVVAALRETSR